MAVLDLPARAQRVGANRLAPHAALFACLVMWSLNAVVLKVGLTHVRPLPFTTVRFVIAGLILLTAGSLVKTTVLRPPPLRLLLPAAALGMFLNQVAFSEGLHLTTAVDTSLIMGVSPILTAVVLVIWTRTEVSRGQWLALGLGFLGTVAVVAQTGAHPGQGSLLGDLIVVGAPASWAVYMVLVYEKAQGQSMPPLTAYSMLAGAAMMLPAALLLAGPGRDDWAGAALPLAYTSIVATALPWTLYFWALPRIGVTATSIYTYLQPPLGACFGALFLHEAVGWGQVAGAVLILLAAYLGSWRFAPKPLPRAEAT